MTQLKKKSSLYFFVSLTCFTWASSVCFSLPSVPAAQSGSVELEYPNSRTMVIKPSDGAILHYEDFQVGSGEEVRFIQKDSSCVLHRITGENPSQILGALESNGKIVFVNPNGIHFGSDSKVDAGSLVVSTLDISSKNFLKKNDRFDLLRSKKFSIVVDGSLRAKEGSIVLLAPHIRNLGSIKALHGSVSLGSGNQAQFNGANLSVSGSLKEGLIEQLGSIQALEVFTKLPVDTKSITDRGETHKLFVGEYGEAIFGSASNTKAEKVCVEGSFISIKGSIDATNAFDKGGAVYLFGKDISLEGAKIDSSGLLAGGKVLIGGEFQGKGLTAYASTVFMDEASTILANGYEADGGLVVLWSQDRTQFEGKIFAQSSAKEGTGGLVETSSKGKLEVFTGKVDTFGSKEIGEWLLDPHFIKIVSSGSNPSYSDGVYGNCDNKDTWNFPASAFLNLQSSLTLTSYCGTIITSDFTVTTAPNYPKANVTFTSCSTSSAWGTCAATFSGGDTINPSQGIIQLPNNGTITMKTDGGSINFSPPIWTQSSFVIDTTYNGATGGDINLSSIFCMNHEDLSVTMTAGTTGTINANTMPAGSTSGWQEGYLRTMTINSAKSVVIGSGGIRLLSGFTCNAPVCISGSAKIDTTADGISTYGGNIVIQSVEGPGTIICKTGSGFTTTLGSVGKVTPLASFNPTSVITLQKI